MNLHHFINDEKGEVTLLGLFLALIVLVSIGIIMNKMISYHQEMNLRLDTYTCFKKSIDLIKDSESEMFIHNKALLIAHAMKATPAAPYALASIQILKVLQLKVLLFFKMKAARLTKCSLWNRLKVLKHFPYETKGQFNIVRAPLDQAIPKMKVKPLIIKAQKNMLTVFTLEAEYKFWPTFQVIKTSEKSSFLKKIRVL